MLRIGLTGSIGSGKSTVARVFKTLGIPVYDADAEAKRISARTEVKREIAECFGEEAAADKKVLASIVFGNPEALEKLNRIVHPLVFEDSRQWFQSLSERSGDGIRPGVPPYAIVESAILFDCGMAPMFESVIDVEAPLEEQIARSQARDHSSREAVLSRLEKQMDARERMAKSDFVIHNGKQDCLLAQILEIDRVLREKGNPVQGK